MNKWMPAYELVKPPGRHSGGETAIQPSEGRRLRFSPRAGGNRIVSVQRLAISMLTIFLTRCNIPA